MSRKDLFGNRDLFKGEGEPDRKDYRPPEEKLVDSELINRLVEHYVTTRDSNRLVGHYVGPRYSKWANLCNPEAFEYNAETLKSIIKDRRDKFQPQPLIDALTLMLVDESDKQHFTRADYLTAVVQALYNLGYNDFIIDIREWQKDGWAYYAGGYLKGREDSQLTLNLYGRFSSCCYYAKHCNFILNDSVGRYGWEAANCTFNIMPNVNINVYFAAKFNGNVLRRMNKDGKWEEIG